MSTTRTEKDAMGTMKVPAGALYGARQPEPKRISLSPESVSLAPFCVPSAWSKSMPPRSIANLD